LWERAGVRGIFIEIIHFISPPPCPPPSMGRGIRVLVQKLYKHFPYSGF